MGMHILTACAALCIASFSMAAEIINYPSDGTALQIEPDAFGMMLAPSESNSGKSRHLSGNEINMASDEPSLDVTVYGALNFLDTDVVNGNTVQIRGFTPKNIYGGAAILSVQTSTLGIAAINNKVAINGGGVDNRGVSDIVGGYAYNMGFGFTDPALSANNTVTLTDVVYGEHGVLYVNAGRAYGGVATAANNGVQLTNASIVSGAIGGITSVNVYGTDVIAEKNYVIVENSHIENYGISTTEAFGTNIAISIDNFILFSESIVSSSVLSAGLAWGTGLHASAIGNYLSFIGGEIGSGSNVEGARADVFAGGGKAHASGNHIFIGGKLVIGDHVHFYGGSVSGGTVAHATENSITFGGNLIFGKNIRVYGGLAAGDGAIDAFSGNTLNLHTTIAVEWVQNFEYFNFFLPTTFQAEDVMLTADVVYLSDNDRLATINVAIDGAASPLKPGDTVTLIDAGALIGRPANDAADGAGMQGQHGATLRYAFDIAVEGDRLVATVDKTVVNERAKAFSEGFLGGLGTLAETGDLVAQKSTHSAASAALAGGGIGAFSAISAGSLRHKTGSHVDASGASLAVGLARTFDKHIGYVTMGAFIEYGNSSYETYNAFPSVAVCGKGDIWHLGGGLLARLDAGPLYVDASLRAGGTANKYSADLGAYYKSSPGYTGGHVGAGHAITVGGVTITMSGQYLWTRQDNSQTRLSSGETIDFKYVFSSRTRLGMRATWDLGKRITPYIGTAWEYEHDGKAYASVNGYALPVPSMRGGAGIGELGISIHPDKRGLTFDASIQGHIGKRRGVTGALQVGWKF